MGVDLNNNQLERTGTLANPFTGTEYFTNIDASGNIDIGSMARFTLLGAAPGVAAGDVWFDNVTDPGGADKMVRYDAAGGGAVVMVDDNYTLNGTGLGDVGGTPLAPSLTGIQGLPLAGALSDGEVNVYDASAGQIVQSSIAGAQVTKPGWHLTAQSGALFAWIQNTNQLNGGWAGDLQVAGGGAPGSWLDFDFWMTSGTTWYLILAYAQDVNGSPQVDILLDGVSLGTTFSCNAPLPTYNQFVEIFNFTVTNPGKHTIRVVDTSPGPFEIAVSQIGVFLV